MRAGLGKAGIGTTIRVQGGLRRKTRPGSRAASTSTATPADPANNSDPFGLWPLLSFGVAGGGAITAGEVLEGIGLGAAAAAAAPYVAAAAIVGGVAGGIYYADHARATSRVRTSLQIAQEHIDAAGAPPPGGEDPDWKNDKLKQAQKHLNNAKKYVKDVLGKTKAELEKQIEQDQQKLNAMREVPSKP